jgi:hypothetical protein
MRLIDADALRAELDAAGAMLKDAFDLGSIDLADILAVVDAAPSIACAADNPHGLVPSRCPTCGEELVPYPCMDLAQGSYRDGILYGQRHPDTTMKETT